MNDQDPAPIHCTGKQTTLPVFITRPIMYLFLNNRDQRRTGCSNGTRLSRQIGPISSGVTRNSGTPAQIFKLSSPSSAKGPRPPPAFHSFLLLLFVTLSLAHFSPLLSYTSPVNGVYVSRLTKLQHLMWRPTWTADQPAHLVSARQPGDPVRP